MPLSQPLGELLRSHGVRLAGISHVVPPYAIGRPDPDFHLVLYTIAGHAHLTTEHGEYPVQAGDLVLCPAHNAHAYQPVGEWQIAWFHLADTSHWAAMRKQMPQVRSAPDFPKIHWVMKEFIEEGLRAQPEGNTATRSYADVLLYYLGRELPRQEAEGERTMRECLHRVWARVNHHLQHPWSVEELAALTPCSPAQLFRLTATLHGTTPMAMVTRLRIDRVRELLRSTDYTLEHIAILVGYATPFALSRAFRRHTGCAPHTFRRQR
ncbi:MAG: helix-turn-helix domain-containing protein [Armatimonadota bacterium]